MVEDHMLDPMWAEIQKMSDAELDQALVAAGIDPSRVGYKNAVFVRAVLKSTRSQEQVEKLEAQVVLLEELFIQFLYVTHPLLGRELTFEEWERQATRQAVLQGVKSGVFLESQPIETTNQLHDEEETEHGTAKYEFKR